MIVIHPNTDQVAASVAGTIAATVAADRATTIGLAGGSTPRTTYEHLALSDVDWSGVTLWLGDERWVPPDDPQSNVLMVRQTLGDVGAARLLAPDYGLGDPHRAAAAYAAALATTFATTGDGRPDLVLLGMGADGHTASLFPGSVALDETGRSYTAAWVAEKASWRLTATLPLLWSAHHIVFLVTGEEKAETLRRVLDDEEPLPARLVGQRHRLTRARLGRPLADA